MSTWTLPTAALLAPSRPYTDDGAENRTLTVLSVLTHAGVDVVDVGQHVAPQMIRYDIQLADGVDPKRVERAVDQLTLALGERVRYAGIAAGRVGVEVNRPRLAPVALRDTIEASEALIRLGLPLGQTIRGPLTARLADMPHLLVAGTTGSGKSVWLTSMLTALLLRNTPDDMRMVLVDPKRVELAAFADLPHLMAPIVTEMTDAALELRHLVDMMEKRFNLFEAAGVKDLDAYNAIAADGEHLPRVVAVIDELADLLMQVKAAEPLLVRLLQKSRAAGMHFILATQRPEAKVFTGLIRSNVPARVCFAVQSHVDSKVALDVTGAEKLRGQGDGLFKAPGVGDPIRFQAPMVPASDVARVVTYWIREALKRADAAPAPLPQPVDEPVDDGAELRAEVEAWQREAASAAGSAMSSLSPEEILGDAGFTPEVVEAFVEVTADRIAALVVQKMAAVLPSNPDNTTEGVTR